MYNRYFSFVFYSILSAREIGWKTEKLEKIKYQQ